MGLYKIGARHFLEFPSSALGRYEGISDFVSVSFLGEKEGGNEKKSLVIVGEQKGPEISPGVFSVILGR